MRSLVTDQPTEPSVHKRHREQTLATFADQWPPMPTLAHTSNTHQNTPATSLPCASSVSRSFLEILVAPQVPATGHRSANLHIKFGKRLENRNAVTWNYSVSSKKLVHEYVRVRVSHVRVHLSWLLSTAAALGSHWMITRATHFHKTRTVETTKCEA